MAQIEYCDEASEGWHPVYTDDFCADVRKPQSRKDRWSIGREPRLQREIKAILNQYITTLLEISREEEFQELAKCWKRETVLEGNLSRIVMHPAYQRIMAMGKDMVPLILSDLAKKPAHWFWALHNLVPEGQDPAEGLTTMEEARQAWLKWGRDNNYL